MSDFDKALKKAEEWLNLEGIVGVAQGEQDGKPCITVFTAVPIDMLTSEIPSELDTFPVSLQFVGTISAL